jgi:hypothetical protein
MGVFGGFAQRKTEQLYNTLIYNMLYLMQYRLKKIVTEDDASHGAFV